MLVLVRCVCECLRTVLPQFATQTAQNVLALGGAKRLEIPSPMHHLLLRCQTRKILSLPAFAAKNLLCSQNLKTLKLMFEHFHTHYRLQDFNIECQPMGTQAATYDQR